MVNKLPKGIESEFESVGHYEESMRDFDRVLDYLDRTENISEERKELYHCSLDEIGMDGVFEVARNTNELFKELGINSYKLQQVEAGRICGRNAYELGIGVHGRTPEEMSEHGRKGGRNCRDLGLGVHGLTPEERSELGRIGGRKGNEAQGNHLWSLEEIVEIGELKYGEGLTWNDTTSKMNEKYGGDWSTSKVIKAYHQNKHRLPDEEE